RGGIVVDDDSVLGGREVREQTGGVTVPFAALSRDEVVLDAHRPSRGGDGGEGPGRERRAAEVGLQHDAGRVDDTPERETFAFREGRARLRRERPGSSGGARGARRSEDA